MSGQATSHRIQKDSTMTSVLLTLTGFTEIFETFKLTLFIIKASAGEEARRSTTPFFS